MSLPTSGPISIGVVAAELGIGLPLSLGDPRVRALAGKPSGPIRLGDLRGKSSFTVAPRNDYSSAQTQFGAGTVSCFPSVTVQGGSGTLTYVWAVLSNSANCTLTLPNGPTATVRFDYFRNASGNAEVILRCTVTDGAGTQRTVDVSGSLEWSGNL